MARDNLRLNYMVRLFAERVLRSPNLSPEQMPELADNPAFRKRKENDRSAIVRGLRNDAASRLIGAGYDAATVKRILCK